MVSPPIAPTEPLASWPSVLEQFGLGPTTATEGVVGGWTHFVWRVDTPEGSFAIKEMEEGPGEWWFESLACAIEFELRAWSAGTVPMAEPIPSAGSEEYAPALGDGEDRRFYRCHRWVDGVRCLDLAPNGATSADIGTTLAALVRLAQPGGSTAANLAWNALDAYEETVAEATSTGADWAPLIADLRSTVEELRDDFVDLRSRAVPMMTIRGDIDPKNASVRSDGRVALFDWDYCGPAIVGSVLLDTAMSFAGEDDDLSASYVHATIDAYRADGVEVSFRDAGRRLSTRTFGG